MITIFISIHLSNQFQLFSFLLIKLLSLLLEPKLIKLLSLLRTAPSSFYFSFMLIIDVLTVVDFIFGSFSMSSIVSHSSNSSFGMKALESQSKSFFLTKFTLFYLVPKSS